jgi:hypothetical protein
MASSLRCGFFFWSSLVSSTLTLLFVLEATLPLDWILPGLIALVLRVLYYPIAVAAAGLFIVGLCIDN